MFKYKVDDTWIKGCLHCHSTSSDGLLEPKDVVDYYLSRGYGLVAITDHGKITTEQVNNQNVVFLPGIEVSKGESKLNEPFHIVALGVNDSAINNLKSPLEVIDDVNATGGVAIIAHPHWTGLIHEDLTNLNGYIGIEVYNTGCDVDQAKGYAVMCWDNLISSDVECWGLAVDDSHRYQLPPVDADGGWVWMKVADNSPEAAVESLKAGHFYSSMGPKFTKLEITKNLIQVGSFPATKINIISKNGRGVCIEMTQLQNMIEMWRNPSKRPLLERKYDSIETNYENRLTKVYLTRKNLKVEAAYVKEGLTQLNVQTTFSNYVRIEVIDQLGRTAWSNPVFNV